MRFRGFAAALLQGPAWLGWSNNGDVTFMRLTSSTCPLREGGGPKGRGWIRLEEAKSAEQGNKKTELGFEERELRFRGFAASILRLWRGPSPRACMLTDI